MLSPWLSGPTAPLASYLTGAGVGEADAASMCAAVDARITARAAAAHAPADPALERTVARLEQAVMAANARVRELREEMPTVAADRIADRHARTLAALHAEPDASPPKAEDTISLPNIALGAEALRCAAACKVMGGAHEDVMSALEELAEDGRKAEAVAQIGYTQTDEAIVPMLADDGTESKENAAPGAFGVLRKGLDLQKRA